MSLLVDKVKSHHCTVSFGDSLPFSLNTQIFMQLSSKTLILITCEEKKLKQKDVQLTFIK